MRVLLFALLLSIVSLSFATPDNVVLVVGDGMGFNHLFLSELLYGENPATRLFRVSLGLNSPVDALITDSAAAATALFSGVRTVNNAAGLDPSGNPVQSVATVLKERGWKVAMITNARYYDGTPAAFYAHAFRTDDLQITEDLVNSDIDLFVAGGLEKLGLNPFTGKPKKNGTLERLAASGYTIYGLQFEKLFEPIGEKKGSMAFLSMGDNSFENALLPNEMSLPEIVRKSLELIAGPKLFLVVEAARIDDASHINDDAAVKAELLAFQKTVRLLLDSFDNSKTLFLILADHETGGLSIIMGDERAIDLEIAWCSGDHTASYIPILSYGEGSESFSDFLHLSDVNRILLEILGGEVR